MQACSIVSGYSSKETFEAETTSPEFETQVVNDFEAIDFGTELCENIFYDGISLTCLNGNVAITAKNSFPNWSSPVCLGKMEMPCGESVFIINDGSNYWTLGLNSNNVPHFYKIYRNIFSTDPEKAIVGYTSLPGYFIKYFSKSNLIVFVNDNDDFDSLDSYSLPKGSEVEIIGYLKNSYYEQHPFSLMTLIKITDGENNYYNVVRPIENTIAILPLN